MYLLSFYVPLTHLDNVKEAIFKTGAGALGAYSHCAWQTEGMGQFKPLEGSHAYIGQLNEIEYVPEYKVEIVCQKETLELAVKALKETHPYEVPAYHVIEFIMP